MTRDSSGMAWQRLRRSMLAAYRCRLDEPGGEARRGERQSTMGEREEVTVRRWALRSVVENIRDVGGWTGASSSESVSVEVELEEVEEV